MRKNYIDIVKDGSNLSIKMREEITLYTIKRYTNTIDYIDFNGIEFVTIDFLGVKFIDSAASVYFSNLEKKLHLKNIKIEIKAKNQDVLDVLNLVKTQRAKYTKSSLPVSKNIIEKIGEETYKNYLGFLSFISVIGEIFLHKFSYLLNIKNIRFKEVAFEINESAVKALGIVILTSFLIGLVVAYQSAHQLRTYGANIFIVDMMGISVLRELSPIITAIVIAGRSASSYTAQIGAMKITQEIDAMQTMGFDPYRFLVLPRIIALMITLPILIFVSDIMAMIAGMLIANVSLGITVTMFLDRFQDVIALKHFIIGLAKGPFFAFLIASIGIYRGLMVKDDTQSIGFNTTKSVVESIFAVIICDAVFSIIFTSLGV
ncbi:MAG: phospholipid/cholesterol/gamma-HCH transport system permease protein [Campylobacterota bacterium]|nr:phospholipid/cholesterol/gamma-HCH transport system permease protein [Campylobacterota bacterium]